MELIVEIFLAGHSVEITIEAVNHDKLATLPAGECEANWRAKFPLDPPADGNETPLDVFF